MKLMNEKASLIERIQELEHITIQLSMETETIGKKRTSTRSIGVHFNMSVSLNKLSVKTSIETFFECFNFF